MKTHLKVDIDYSTVEQMLAALPRLTNQETNKAYKGIASAFMKDFTRARLIPGIFNVKRKVKMKRPPAGTPSIPVKARKAGFVAVFAGRRALAGKYVRIKNSSDLITMREEGKPVRASAYRKGKGRNWVIIRGKETTAFGKSKAGKARRENWQQWKAKQWNSQWARPVLRKVRKAGPFPRINFEKYWGAWFPKRDARLAKIPEEVARRAQLAMKRKTG